MTKVDLKKYFYGLNNYYVVQILRDEGKDLHIVWTRWGRTGSQGQFQRTPFKKAEDAIKEFSSVFRSKTGYAYKDVMAMDSSIPKKNKKYSIKRFQGKYVSLVGGSSKYLEAEIDLKKIFKKMEDIEVKAPKADSRLIDFLEPLVEPEGLREKIENTEYQNSIVLYNQQDR